MKITYLELRNFASIFTAMHKKHIKIDFSKSKNKIVLLVGHNGSGKTSILSTLHPFAYPGNMDVRSNSSMIIGTEGSKEIHYDVDGTKYKIKHVYKVGKTMTVKSFISKDDIELNPNGNVTSFNEAVLNELNITQDYLKILRLGSNVTNIIEMKATERKNFTSDLLSDVNIYYNLYKKVNDDARVIKGILKNYTDKIDRLNISDKSVLESDITRIENTIQQYNNKKESIQHKIGQLEGTINTIIPEGIDKFNEEKDYLKHVIDDTNKDIWVIKKSIKENPVVFIGNINWAISESENNINKIEKQLGLLEGKLSVYLNTKNELYEEKDQLNQKLKLITSDVEYSQLIDLFSELDNKINKLEPKYKRFNTDYTKEGMLTILNILRQIDDIAQNIYEFDNKAVKETVKLIQNSIDVDKYVKDEIYKLETQLNALTSSKAFRDSFKKGFHIVFRPPMCNIDNCPILSIYNEMITVTDDNTVTVTELENKKEYYEEISSIKFNIDSIMRIIKFNIELIDKYSISYLKLSNIYDNIYNCRRLYDESIITRYISEIEEYDDFISLKERRIEVQQEINNINKNNNSFESLSESIKNIDIKILDNERNIKKENHEIEITKDKLIEKQNECELLKEFKSSDDILFERESYLRLLKKDLQEKEELLTKIKDQIKSIDELKDELIKIDDEIKLYNNELFGLKTKMVQYNELTKERTLLNNKYEDISLIRESLSSTKGIPLLFIQIYLKNTKKYVNDLLYSVFADELEIDDFDITATEFNIPYIKNGIRINDVVYASQGERSFLSLALSFALINQSIDKYNILLLDEIDSTLDIKNRAFFLNILEKQMEVIDAEQIFLITHNNMFDNYPVDIIMTSDIEIEDNKNIIYRN